jgi:hypothetical protein
VRQLSSVRGLIFPLGPRPLEGVLVIHLALGERSYSISCLISVGNSSIRFDSGYSFQLVYLSSRVPSCSS